MVGPSSSAWLVVALATALAVIAALVAVILWPDDGDDVATSRPATTVTTPTTAGPTTAAPTTVTSLPGTGRHLHTPQPRRRRRGMVTHNHRQPNPRQTPVTRDDADQ
jgi:hypothetical protein